MCAKIFLLKKKQIKKCISAKTGFESITIEARVGVSPTRPTRLIVDHKLRKAQVFYNAF